MATQTEELAQFAHDLKLADVPKNVVDKVKTHILDLWGSALFGADQNTIRQVREYALAFAKEGRSRLIGSKPVKLDAEYAAMVNASAAHACELDDYHVDTGHPGCVVIPGVLAAAEDAGASGAECLLATIVAFEVACRVGAAATSSTASDRGFHNTSVYGGFGVAAGAACLMKFNHEQFVNALSIAGSHASGLLEFRDMGGEVIRVHAGIGAAGGIRAARMAKVGITGPHTILEGKKGYLQAFSGHPKPERLTENLGREWSFMGSRIKAYACPGNLFQAIEALEGILAANPIKASDIREIKVGCNLLTYGMGRDIEPPDLTKAQFSLPYALGMTIAKGNNDFTTYLEVEKVGFKDPEIMRIARLVSLHVDDECEAMFPKNWTGRVTVLTHDGRTFQAMSVGPREVERSVVEKKYRGLTKHVIPAAQADALLNCINSLEKLDRIEGLSALLATG